MGPRLPLAGNTITTLGEFDGGGVACQQRRAQWSGGNDIYETGSSGISSRWRPHDAHACPELCRNNYIHHTGVGYKQGVGVCLEGVGNRATHNLIHDCPRMGIQFSGNNLVIEYNHVAQ